MDPNEDDILDHIVNELEAEFNGGADIDVVASEEVPADESIDPNVEDENSESARPKLTVVRTRTCDLPLSKIKGIMKLDPDVTMVSSEAVFVVAKATELFIQSLAKETFRHTASQKKKTVQRSHVDSAVTGSESLFFLEDALD